MAAPFLDTNFLLRHLRRDIPNQSAKATALLSLVEAGTLTVRTSDVVIFETVFTLQRSYKESREQIAAGVLPIIQLPGVKLPGKRHYDEVFSLFRSQAKFGFADCYHIVLMRSLGLTEIFTFDTDYDSLLDIRRREA